MKSPESESGFSLVEVLVAFVVLSGAVLLSFRIFSDGLERVHMAERKRAAISMAQRELAALQLEPRLTMGVRLREEGAFRLSSRLTPVGSDRAEPYAAIPMKVEVIVTASDKPDPPLFVLESILLQRAEP